MDVEKTEDHEEDDSEKKEEKEEREDKEKKEKQENINDNLTKAQGIEKLKDEDVAVIERTK